MNKAEIHFPWRWGHEDRYVLDRMHSFIGKLTARGYQVTVHQTHDVHEPVLRLNDELIDYAVAAEQSQTWAPLKSLHVKRLSETAILPTRGSLDCAGLDLYADIPAPLKVWPGEIVKIPVGFALELPTGHYGEIKNRSSMGGKGFAVRGGVIDRDYRGEVKVMLQYVASVTDTPQVIDVNMRVAQLVVLSYLGVQAVEVNHLGPTIRNDGGWGSTGS